MDIGEYLIMMDKWCDIIFEDGVIIDRKIFFSAWNRNGIFSMDLDSLEIRFCYKIPYVADGFVRFFGCICKKGDSLFLGAHQGGIFGEFEIKKNVFHTIKPPGNFKSGEHFFQVAFSYGEYIYFVGASFPGILKYSPKDATWKNINGWVPEIEENRVKNGHFFEKGVCILGNMAFLACSKANYLLVLYLSEDKWELIKLGEEKYCYSDIYCDGEYLWLAPRVVGQPVTCWKPKEKEKIEYPFSWGCDENRYYSGWRIFGRCQYIWLIPLDNSHGMVYVVKISIENGNSHSIKIPIVNQCGVASWLALWFERNAIFADMRTEKVFELCMETDEVKEVHFKWNLASYMIYEGSKMLGVYQGKERQNIWKETGNYALQTLWNEIDKQAMNHENMEKGSGNGQKIHKAIVSNVEG